MSRLFLAGLIWLALATSAFAQTTTLDPANCRAAGKWDGGFDTPPTLSNGNLTLTGPAGANAETGNCWGTVGKWGGKWYYTITLTTIEASQKILGFGIAQGPTIPSTPNFSLYYTMGSTADSTAVSLTDGYLRYTSGSAINVGTFTQGYTAAVAVDFDHSPGPEIWITPDINCASHGGCTGYAGGPMWNGINTSSPEVTGSGGSFGIAALQGFPLVIMGRGSSVTMDFTSNSTLNGYIGSGAVYLPWNTDGPAAPNPGPTNPITFQVANAPGWQAGHAYSLGSRVIAGPGWTPGSPGSFTNGSTIYLWALSGAGGTSGGSAPGGFASCDTPANVGGGFKTGVPPAGWGGATTVSDNGLTWYCLTRVDYVTMTDMNFDSPTTWATSTAFPQYIYMRNGTKYYQQTAGNFGLFSTPPYQCVSASSGGGPTGTGGSISDGNCVWSYFGTQVYSPTPANYWLNQRRASTAATNQRILSGVISDVIVNIWYGGTARQVYQGGQNGETDPIWVQYHNTGGGEADDTFCKGMGYWMVAYPGSAIVYTGYTSCAGYMSPLVEKLTVATGDSFQDNVSAASGPLRYDSTNGVSFYSNSTYTFGSTGSCFQMRDNSTIVERIQCKTTQGTAMDWYFNTSDILRDLLVDSGGPEGAVSIDAQSVIYNSTIIASGATDAGCFGILFKYAGSVYNTTLIGPGAGVTNCAAIQNYGTIGNMASNAIMSNNISFGFKHSFAYGGFGIGGLTYTSGNNATDITSLTTATFNSAFDDTGPPISMTSMVMPGLSQIGLTPSAELQNSTLGSSFDARIKNTGDLYANGGAFTTFALGGNGLFYPEPLAIPSTDNLNTARPTSGRYDIGATQFVPSGASPTAGTGVGRRWGR